MLEYWKSHNENKILLITGVGWFTGKCWLIEAEEGVFGLTPYSRDVAEIEHRDH